MDIKKMSEQQYKNQISQNKFSKKNTEPIIDVDEYIGDIQYQSKDIMDNNPNAIRSNDVFVLYSLASSS